MIGNSISVNASALTTIPLKSAHNSAIEKPEEEVNTTPLEIVSTTLRTPDTVVKEDPARLFEIEFKELSELMEMASEDLARFEKDLYEDAPSLMNVEWDFTINSEGDLEAIFADDVSDEDRTKIQSALDDSSLDLKFGKAQELMLEAIHLQRGERGLTSDYSKHELTKENFNEVIEFRSMVSEINHEMTKDSKSHSVSRAFVTFDSFKSQLSSRAESVYDSPLLVETTNKKGQYIKTYT